MVERQDRVKNKPRLLAQSGRVRASLAAVLIVTLIGGVFSEPTIAAGPFEMSISPEPPVVGVNIHPAWADRAALDGELDQMDAAGITSIRMDVAWDQVEPVQGEFAEDDYVAIIDDAVDAIRSHDIEILAVVTRAPEWASDQGDEAEPPKLASSIGGVMEYLAERYAGRIDTWQIWNEPNDDRYFAGADPVDYVDMAEVAAAALRAGNPDVTIVGGGTSYIDIPWLRTAYEAGLSDTFDVMAVAPYQGRNNEEPELPPAANEHRITDLDALADLMDEFGDDGKPVWFVEFGWSTNANTADTKPYALGVTPEQQADYLLRTIELLRVRYPQVDKIFWYNFRERTDDDATTNARGLTTSDGTPKPAFDALAGYLTGSAVPMLSIADGTATEDFPLLEIMDGWIDFTVSIQRATDVPVSGTAVVVTNSASATDVDTASTLFTIEPGERSTSVRIPVKTDLIPESAETFWVTLVQSNEQATAARLGRRSATGTIVDNDLGLPLLDLSDAQGPESRDGRNAENNSLDFVVKLSKPSATPVTFRATTNHYTTSDDDYFMLNDQLGGNEHTILAGETITHVFVGMRNDAVVEDDEAFTVTLTEISGASPTGRTIGIGTIRNDDAPGVPGSTTTAAPEATTTTAGPPNTSPPPVTAPPVTAPPSTSPPAASPSTSTSTPSNPTARAQILGPVGVGLLPATRLGQVLTGR